MDLSNLHVFCGIANKKDYKKEIKIFGKSEILLFDVLEKNGMIYFKDTKNGNICRAIGFMFLHKNIGWDRIENILVDSGFSQNEAKFQIANEKALIGLYKNINKLRTDYRSSTAKSSNSNVFGDWLLISRAEFYDVFRPIFEQPIQKSSDYNICLMRDESGIPSCVFVYSSGHRFLGSIRLGITDSTTLIQYNSSIDKMHWNCSKQILSQEIDVASFVDNISQDDSDIPVGLIVSCESVSNYGSVQPPTTFWVAKYDEAPHKIINFFNGTGTLMTCRLPNKNEEAFTPVASFSSSFLSKSSVEFCKDVSAFASKNKKTDIDDFVKCYLATSSINREAKTMLIKEYANRMGIDHEKAISLVKKYGIGADTLTVEGKTYFVKDSKYFVTKRGNVGTEVSNFFVQPETVYDVDGKRRMVEGFFTADGKVHSFCINRNCFLNSTDFLSEMVKIADLNGAIIPKVYSYSDIMCIRRMVTNAIDSAPVIKIKELGLRNQESYITSTWETQGGEIKFFDKPLPLAGQSDLFKKQISIDEKTYRSIAIRELNNLCKNESTKTLIFLLIKTINTKLNNGTSRLYLTRDTFVSCSNILGSSVSDNISANSQLQLSINDCTTNFANKNEILAIVLSKPTTIKSKNTTNFTDNIKISQSTVPLLPELMRLALSTSPAKAMQEICNTEYINELARSEKLSYVFRGGESKEFFEHVKDLALEKEFFHEDSNGNLIIEIAKCIKTLKGYGIHISKNLVIKDLRDSGMRFVYPIRKFKDRSTCLVIYKQNKENLKNISK